MFEKAEFSRCRVQETTFQKYDPEGNRVWKQSTVSGQTTTGKYIVDIVGDLPVILMEIDPADSSIKKTYINANGQILAQHDGPYTASRYFYLHDRLGSVRQIIDTSGNVVKYYTYNPFGETLESGGSLGNSFMFTGQYYDVEIAEYYLRARQYDPHIARFTSRDPIFGQFEEPLTLHRYLYCINDPINRTDLAGLWTIHIMGAAMASLGPASFMVQAGLVFDDNGNVGWIVSHNLHGIVDVPSRIPRGIEDFGGFGTPAFSIGVAVGYTTADTIFDLQGEGVSIGGSYGSGWAVGIDYLCGEQRSGKPYHGLEFTFGAGATPWSVEVHAHHTQTIVKPLNWNYMETLGRFEEFLEESIFHIETVGQGYGLFLISENLD